MLGPLGPIAFALLTGRLVALDSQPVAGVRVIIEWRGESLFATADTLPVDSSGRFGALIRDIGGEAHNDSVSLIIDASPTSRYAPARVVVSKSRLSEEIRILLVPRRWMIRRGRYAGSEVSIDPSAALRRIPNYGSFGRLSATRVVGWMPGSFPIPVVLRRDGPRITPADSIAFWDAVRDVESALGGHFFEPWSDTAMFGRIFPVDVRIDRRISGSGLTFATWDAAGNIFEGSIRFHGSREMQIPAVVEHELMHVLGFGHTTAWPSTMETRTTHARVLTEDDVAYAQLLMVAHERQQDSLVVGGLIEAAKPAQTLPPGDVSSHFPRYEITASVAPRERHPRLGDSPDRR
jgi:hypothetical protein